MKLGKKTILLGTLLLLCSFSLGMVQTTQAKNPLNCTIDYTFVGHLGIVDAEGRLLAWIGTVSGVINGEINWWMNILDKKCPQVTHFAGDLWEILDFETGEPLLRGDEHGTTTIRHGKNSVWRSNGIVTEAYGDLAIWLGRNVHMSGHFEWIVPGFPGSGSGIMRIN